MSLKYYDGLENIYDKINSTIEYEEFRKRKREIDRQIADKISQYIKSKTDVKTLNELLKKWERYSPKFDYKDKVLYFYSKIDTKDIISIRKDVKKFYINDIIILDNRYIRF